MRRVWRRIGSIDTTRTIPASAGISKIVQTEQVLAEDENRRAAVKQLFALYALGGYLDQARGLAEKWAGKEPLDPEALIARADIATRDGDRDSAIRILTGVADVRPGDVDIHRRLARLHRLNGTPELGCRHSVTAAQLREQDAKLLAAAVGCSRQLGHSVLAEELLAAATDETRKQTEPLLASFNTPDELLRGELRLEATWQGAGQDLDLYLQRDDGHSVSWLGAPAGTSVTARDVTSDHQESLALQGAKAGQYVVELVRSVGPAQVPISGTVRLSVAGSQRTVAFVLPPGANRVAIAIASIRLQSRLVPL